MRGTLVAVDGGYTIQDITRAGDAPGTHVLPTLVANANVRKVISRVGAAIVLVRRASSQELRRPFQRFLQQLCVHAPEGAAAPSGEQSNRPSNAVLQASAGCQRAEIPHSG